MLENGLLIIKSSPMTFRLLSILESFKRGTFAGVDCSAYDLPEALAAEHPPLLRLRADAPALFSREKAEHAAGLALGISLGVAWRRWVPVGQIGPASRLVQDDLGPATYGGVPGDTTLSSHRRSRRSGLRLGGDGPGCAIHLLSHWPWWSILSADSDGLGEWGRPVCRGDSGSLSRGRSSAISARLRMG